MNRLFVVFIFNILSSTYCELEDVFSMVQKLLSQNDFTGALNAYNGAIMKDNTNCAFKEARGSLLMSLGRPDEAYKDFFFCKDKNRNPVKLILAAKQIGKIDDAITFAKETNSEETKELANKMIKLQELLKEANQLYEKNILNDALNKFNSLKEELTHDFTIFEKLYQISKKLGDYEEALKSLRIIFSKFPDKSDDFMEDAIRIDLYDGGFETSLETSRKCLKRDQDSKVCKALYRDLKTLVDRKNKIQELLNKENNQEAIESIDDAINALKDGLIIEKSVIIFDPMLCQAHALLSNKETTEICKKAVKHGNNKADSYYYFGKYYMANEKYDEAIDMFNKALEIDSHHAKAKQSIESVNKIKKQLAKKDYYKILGVSKTANTKAIKKAYRKLSLQWHPDKNPDDPKAVQMYNDIVRANEILSDKKKREMYDQGIDPSDPEAQQQQHHHHHQQGFNSFFHGFQGNPFQGFNFHF